MEAPPFTAVGAQYDTTVHQLQTLIAINCRHKIMVFRLYTSGEALDEDGDSVHIETTTTTTKPQATNQADGDVMSISSHSSDGSSSNTTRTAKAAWKIGLLITLLGCAASAAFLSIGILSARRDSQNNFESDVDQVAGQIHSAFREYETAGRWVHQFCMGHKLLFVDRAEGNNSSSRPFFTPNFRSLFRELYESIVAQGLPLYAIQYVPNVTHSDRAAYEAEARLFYENNYPEIAETYTGLSGLVPDNTSANGLRLSTQPDQDFYYPVHYVEPILNNTQVIDFDTYSEDYPRWAVNTALETQEPVITGRLRLLQEYDPNPNIYSVLLIHPGMNYSNPYANNGNNDRSSSGAGGDVSFTAIRIPSLLHYIATQEHISKDDENHVSLMTIYLYDSTPEDETLEGPLFLGGAQIDHNHHQGDLLLEYMPPVEMDELTAEGDNRYYQTILKIGRRQWTLVAISGDGTYPPSITFALIGGIMIIFAFLCLALWVYASMNRNALTAHLKTKAQEARSRLNIEHARQAAAAERQLNEFIAHEVRNPLSAAMSACSFVTSAIQQEDGSSLLFQKQSPTNNIISPPMKMANETASTAATASSNSTPPALFQLPKTTTTSPALREQQTPETEETRETILTDLNIIDASLQFVNDLLRNMLDVQRAACHQLKIEKGPTDMIRDILEPVDAMLYRRGKQNVEVILDCPYPNLIVHSDRLRLKQVILNLGRNSAKFVEKGFIRFRVVVVTKKSLNNAQGNGIADIDTGDSSKINNQQQSDLQSVQIWVEDSGPGIPNEKKTQLFAKFQESLDSLSQGTGLGLSLCKILVRLMGGAIWLDDTYDSGVEGRPGSRFVIDLCSPPMYLDEKSEETDDVDAKSTNSCGKIGGVVEELGGSTVSTKGILSSVFPAPMKTTLETSAAQQQSLPPSLSVMFVDDDPILRKLLVRGVRAIAPGWEIQEAASGETALRLAATSDGDDDEGKEESKNPMKYDLIFMDQYMASMEKQLLGTETTHSLRSQGVKSIICGLSANDIADDFFAAGANAFICKPMPVKKDVLRHLLLEILNKGTNSLIPEPSASSSDRTHLGHQSSGVIFPPEEQRQ